MEKYKFGEFIYNKRKSLGLTQDDLGRKLGVTNKAVSKWETGETLPDINLLPMLATVLGVTIDELLTQKKVEPIVEYKKTNVVKFIIPIVLLSILCLILLFSLLPEPSYIDIENINEYYDIDTCSNVVVDGSNVIISGDVNKIKEINGYELVLSFTIVYSYYDNSDSICEILYIDRKVIITDEIDTFTIELKPKTEVENFKGFYSLSIDYKIVEVKSI